MRERHKELLDAALKYVRLGWQVFPCHPTGHQPLVKRGFYAATSDAQQIQTWWSEFPDAAIGLRTGQESGVFAVDIDPRNGGDISLEELESKYGQLPETAESQTGGSGCHLLFNWPGRAVPCSVGKIGPGIDVKGDGGYIILPPSDHKSGRQYCWLIDQAPGECQYANAPAWLMELIEQDDHTSSAPTNTGTDDEIPQGYRNTTLANQAGHMRQIGMTADEIAPALQVINLRHCKPPLEKAEVERIAASIGRYDPNTSRQAQIECWPERYLGDLDAQTVTGPILTCLADVQPCDVEWLWPKRIAIGKITMLAGDPGLGKSFCSMDIAARVSAGLSWPDLPDQPQEPGDVIILSAEDALDDTIRPRLDAACADASCICALQAIREIDPNTGKPRQRGFHLDKDIDNLEHALKQRPDCRLVVIDPISSYMGDANSHNNAEVRGLLAPVSDLAARYRVAVLCISHLNKGAGDAMYRVMGSLAFVAAARAGYAVVKDCKDDTGQRRLILPIKNNLGDDETGLAYRIMETAGNDQPHVEWEPEVVYTTINEALGVAKTKDEISESTENKQHRQSQVTEAVDWLTSYLADGEKSASEVISAAKADGIAQRTLDRAKSRAGVIARREGYSDGGRWMWRRINLDALVEQSKAATEA